MIQALLEKGVHIPCPTSIVLENIDISRIQPGAILYPGTILRGQATYIGQNAKIGEGGGALIENAQIGCRTKLMQGVYRDCTILDDVVVRNGAEIREGCLLEEGVELGHTVGLKQTIFFPNVVVGSLINFCDALMSGGRSRKEHSEIGSCMALYNYTPQGDKFASLFGNVNQGVFLNQAPIFIGGQTQIVSPVVIGFGTVLGAGSKVTQNVSNNHIYCGTLHELDKPFEPVAIWHPDIKVENTLYYIEQLEYLKIWYQRIRLPVFMQTESQILMESGLERIEAGIKERQKRLSIFIKKLPLSLEYHKANHHDYEIESHQRALKLADAQQSIKCDDAFRVDEKQIIAFDVLLDFIRKQMSAGKSYVEAISLFAQSNLVSV